jgi:hypothetical protein
LNRSGINLAFSLLLLLAIFGWGGWLLKMRKSTLDYVVAAARKAPAIPDCQWVAVPSPSIATLGLSFDPGHAWTDRKRAYLAFRTSRVQASVELKTVAMVARIQISADGGSPERLSGALKSKGSGIVRLPLRPDVPDGVHSIVIGVVNPKPPHGRDLRWLGLAISGIRACKGT